MGRYRKVEVRIWNDEKFRTLSDDGKLAFLFILTHPHLTPIGAMRATEAGLAAELGWLPGRFSKAFQEALSKGIVWHDDQASFMALPRFLRHNRPESPNVVKSWEQYDELLPECRLKDELYQHVRAFAEGFGEAFAEALPDPFGKAMPNQEQEQEHKQEQEQEQEQKEKALSVSTSAISDVQTVFAHFAKSHPRSKLTDPRKRLIASHLKAGYSVEDLCTAIDGLHLCRWHIENGNLTIEYGLRNGNKIDGFIEIATNPRHPKRVDRGKVLPKRDKATVDTVKDYIDNQRKKEHQP